MCLWGEVLGVMGALLEGYVHENKKELAHFKDINILLTHPQIASLSLSTYGFDCMYLQKKDKREVRQFVSFFFLTRNVC